MAAHGTKQSAAVLTETLLASLILTLVLVVCYMCIRLFVQRRRSAKSNFLSQMIYRPACGSQWLLQRRDQCRGVSKGEPPSIEAASSLQHAGYGVGGCAGVFQIPP